MPKPRVKQYLWFSYPVRGRGDVANVGHTSIDVACPCRDDTAVLPHITASIVVAVLGVVWPLGRCQRARRRSWLAGVSGECEGVALAHWAACGSPAGESQRDSTRGGGYTHLEAGEWEHYPAHSRVESVSVESRCGQGNVVLVLEMVSATQRRRHAPERRRRTDHTWPFLSHSHSRRASVVIVARRPSSSAGRGHRHRLSAVVVFCRPPSAAAVFCRQSSSSSVVRCRSLLSSVVILVWSCLAGSSNLVDDWSSTNLCHRD